MYVYEVGYYSCDDSEYWQLVHKKKFTEKQFNKMIEEALFMALIKICEPKSKWKLQRNPPFYRLMVDRIQKKNRKTKKIDYSWPFMDALKKYGFEFLEFQQKWNINGFDSSISIRKNTQQEKINLTRKLKRRLLKEKPYYKEYFKKGEENEKKEKEKGDKNEC